MNARDKERRDLKILQAILVLEARETTRFWGGVFAADVARATGIAPRSMGGILSGLHTAGLIGGVSNAQARCNVYYLRGAGHQALAAGRSL